MSNLIVAIIVAVLVGLAVWFLVRVAITVVQRRAGRKG
jgi:uncharacterized membrane protein